MLRRFLSAGSLVLILNLAFSGTALAYYPGQPKTAAKAEPKIYPSIPLKKAKTADPVKHPLKYVNQGENIIVPQVTKKIFPQKGKKYKPEMISVKRGETVVIDISYLGVNRVVFPSFIKYAHDSKTGDISILLQGRNAYIQTTPLVITEGAKKKIVYPKNPTSTIFVTENDTYSIVFVPKKIFPETVFIKGNFSVKNGGFKNKVQSFIEKTFIYAYRGLTPRGFSKEAEDKILVTQYPEVKLKLVKKFKNYRYELFEIYAENTTNAPLNLSNKEFIGLYSNPVAISISHEKLMPETYTRLFILRRRHR